MSKKALIVDDDDMTIIYLKNFLKQEGFTAESVDNWNAGVEKWKRGAFDLIIVDFNLPDMEGEQSLS